MEDHTQSLIQKVEGFKGVLTSVLSQMQEETQTAQAQRFWKESAAALMAWYDPTHPLRRLREPSPWVDRQESHLTRTLSAERSQLLSSLHAERLTTHPLDSFSTEDFPIELQFAVDHALELGTGALRLPTVCKVLSTLEALVINDTVSMPLRKEVHTLLQALFKAMMPCHPSFPWFEQSRPAMLRRAAMLQYYEKAYAKIEEINSRLRNRGFRLQELCETFPDFPKNRLDRLALKPEPVAQEITAHCFGSTAQTVRKVLQQARKDRTHLHQREAEEDRLREALSRISEEESDRLAMEEYQQNPKLFEPC